MSSKAKILLVDDVAAILEEEERVVKSLSPDITVLKVGTGQDAIKAIVAQRPDVVFLDLILPDLHGDAVCKWVKSKPELADVNIVIVTARNDDAQLQRSFQSGCDAYVTKPIDAEDIKTKVNMLLSEKGIYL